MLIGWKTFLIGLGIAIFPQVTEYVGGFDWTQVLPTSFVWLAPTISGVIMMGMRALTTTSIFKKPDVTPPPAA